MPSDKLPTASISFEGARNVHTQLSKAGIDFVTVHDSRILAIYATAIFNVTTEDAPLTDTSTATIECWEPPLPEYHDSSPATALKALQDILTTGSLSGESATNG